MKNIVLTFIFFAFLTNVSAQLKVNTSGQVGIGISPLYQLHVVGDTYVTGNILLGSSYSSFLATTSGPVRFKANNTLAGSTGIGGSSCVSFGYGALNDPNVGYNNVAFGGDALRNTTWLGEYNTAIGNQALYNNTTSKWNTAIGYQALYNNTENGNTATGFRALYSNTTGYGNTANGYQALYSNTSYGYNNTAIGYQALYNNICWHNTAIGYHALYNTVMGGDNTAIGSAALGSNTTGIGNTAIGSHALYSNISGHDNVAIGEQAGVNVGNLNYTIAIGYNAKATASNQVRLGNYTVTSVGSTVTWSVVSDGRTKKNIRAAVPGLSFINQLQPVMYNLNLDALDELQKSDDPRINHFNDSIRMARSPEQKAIEAEARANKEKIVYSGFIAQDVEKVAQSVGYDFSGVDAPENGKGAYGLRYAEFVVPLVKAVQELNGQNERLQEQVNELIEAVREQQIEIEELKAGVFPANLRSDASAGGIASIKNENIAVCQLFQNAPNPFSVNTEIRYFLPSEIANAYLYIYDMQGKQIKSLLITQRGEGSVQIRGAELSAGMYLYSLIVDGKEVDTKRMILTK